MVIAAPGAAMVTPQKPPRQRRQLPSAARAYLDGCLEVVLRAEMVLSAIPP